MNISPIDVVTSLRALSSELDRLDEVAARHYGLNRTDMRVLEIVSRLGQVAPTELARQVGFTTGGITTVIDRLERSGYVTRRPEGTDRRRIVIESTEATKKRDRVVFGPLAAETQALLGRYSVRNLQTIREFMDEVAQVTARFTATLADPSV